MTEVEFCKTMEQMFFVADEKHSQVAYHTSLAHAAWDNLDVVPISKLAQIGAYFYLIQLMNDMTQSISQLVNETRSQIREKEMADGLSKTHLKCFFLLCQIIREIIKILWIFYRAVFP